MAAVSGHVESSVCTKRGGLQAIVGYCPSALQALRNCETQTELSNLGAILAIACFVTIYLKLCGLKQLAMHYLSQFLGQEAKSVGAVCICATISEASAKRLEGWGRASAKDSFIHMPGGCYWLTP